MQFVVDIEIVAGVRFHSLPVEDPKALRKVEVSQAIIPMSENISQCLHIIAGFPVKAKSIFRRMPAVEQKQESEDWKDAYIKQELNDSLNPDNKLVVYDLKPELKYRLDEAEVNGYKQRKIYFRGKECSRFPGGKKRWNYKKPQYKKYVKPLDTWAGRKEILNQYLISDISEIVLNLAFDAPSYRELDNHKFVDMKMAEEWQIGDIISKIIDHGRSRVVCRVVGMSKEKYIYGEELYYTQQYENGITTKIYDPKKKCQNSEKVKFRKNECHSFLTYDDKFKVENGQIINMLN